MNVNDQIAFNFHLSEPYLTAKKSLKISKGGNQNSYIEEEQTTQCQWPNVKGQKDKQRSTKHYTENFRSISTKTGGELGCPGRVSSSCSTSGTRQ